MWRRSWPGCAQGDADHPPLAASSAGRAVVAVRGMHAFAAAEGLAGQDPARPVRPPAPPRRLPKAISVAEVERLLQAAGAGDGPAPLRDRALLELLYGTGARISEAIGLDIDDLDLASGHDAAAPPGDPAPAGPPAGRPPGSLVGALAGPPAARGLLRPRWPRRGPPGPRGWPTRPPGGRRPPRCGCPPRSG